MRDWWQKPLWLSTGKLSDECRSGAATSGESITDFKCCSFNVIANCTKIYGKSFSTISATCSTVRRVFIHQMAHGSVTAPLHPLVIPIKSIACICGQAVWRALCTLSSSGLPWSQVANAYCKHQVLSSICRTDCLKYNVLFSTLHSHTHSPTHTHSRTHTHPLTH